MKLALGLHVSDFTSKNLSFARQIGADSLVLHLTDYKDINLSLEGVKSNNTVKFTNTDINIWSIDHLQSLQKIAKKYSLSIVAIENFDPGLWHDILLDGPNRDEQIEIVKYCIRNASKSGINVIHYNFSVAGIWGWYKAKLARGGATSIAFDVNKINVNEPIPSGMVWNMFYKEPDGSYVQSISHEKIWNRVGYFLHKVVPFADKHNVCLAAHPDDPPLDTLRQTARLINSPSNYFKLLDIYPNPSNGINFCLGTTQEMADGDVYEILSKLLIRKVVHIVHFRNVKGKVPKYYETFPDEGDINMKKIVELLNFYEYEGILMPDHTPEITCKAPWHAGMAFTMGYIKGLIEK